MSFDIVEQEVNDGLAGKNNGIPMGFDRLNHYVGIRRRILTLVFGSTGSGKTAFIHSAYILNPFDWYIKNKDKTDIKFKVILFSMERSKVYILAKWISRRIFIDYGILIPIQKMLGWWDVKMTKDEHDLFLAQRDYLGELLEVVDIIEGPQNPRGVFVPVNEYALKNGVIHQIDKFNKVYEPNHPNEIVIVAEDHLGLTKTEKDYTTKKAAIDKVSEYNQMFRDLFGYSPVAVSMLNRSLSNPVYQKMESFEPNIDDVKETGRPGEDSDVVISLFDPIRYKTTDPTYNVDKFIDSETGANYFRRVKILKNSYGEDLVGSGMAFQGSTGIFSELPKKSLMTSFDYNELFNGSYFLTNK